MNSCFESVTDEIFNELVFHETLHLIFDIHRAAKKGLRKYFYWKFIGQNLGIYYSPVNVTFQVTN